MKREAVLSSLAEIDLSEIWLFAANENISRADRMIDQLTAKIDYLAEFPEMGKLKPEYGDEMRCFPFGAYLVFYRKRDEGVRVFRILHASRDIESILG